MSRTGPEFVSDEDDLLRDLDRKLQDGEISAGTAEGFKDLYAFAEEVGDTVDIGGAKHANFQVKIAAHQGEYDGDPSVFTANVDKEVQIWPARMILENDPELETVAWTRTDYEDFAKAFAALDGVTQGAVTADFDTVVTNGDIEAFKAVVNDFVTVCRERAAAST